MRGVQQSPRRTLGRIDVLVTAVAMAYAAWAFLRVPRWTVDDAFIVARYAENAVAHGRLAFNLEGDRVEGFTSVVAMALAIAARAVGLDPIAATKAVSALAYVALAPMILRLARLLRAPAPTGGLVALVNALLAEHATHATSGLETEIFVAASLAVLLAFASALRRPSASLLPLAAASAFAALVRPEGLASAVFLALALLRRGGDRRARRDVAAGFVLPLAIVEAARAAYFHDLLPNTFYAKSGGWNTAHLAALGHVVLEAAVAPIAVAAAVIVLGRLFGRRAPRLDGPTRAVALASLAVLAAQALAYGRSVPVMDYGRRFAFHGVAFVVVLVVVAVGAAVRAATSLPARALVLVGVAAAASHGIDRVWSENYRSAEYVKTMWGTYVPAAVFIRDHTRKDGLLAVYPDAGIVPLVSGRTTIDFGRLNDRVLARTRDGDDAAVVAYFFAHRPDVFFVSEPNPGKLYESGAIAIVEAPAFAESYRLARRFETAWGSAVRVYERVR